MKRIWLIALLALVVIAWAMPAMAATDDRGPPGQVVATLETADLDTNLDVLKAPIIHWPAFREHLYEPMDVIKTGAIGPPDANSSEAIRPTLTRLTRHVHTANCLHRLTAARMQGGAAAQAYSLFKFSPLIS